MRLVNELRREHEVAVACPPGRPAGRCGRRRAHPPPGAPEVDVSMRLHPVATPRGLAKMSSGGLALARAASALPGRRDPRQHPARGADGAVAVRAGRAPGRAAHSRSPAAHPDGPRVRAVVLGSASEVIAVSDYTARMFNEGLDHPVATRVYNSIDHERFDPAVVQPGAGARASWASRPTRCCSARSPRSRRGRARPPRSARSPSCASAGSTPTC